MDELEDIERKELLRTARATLREYLATGMIPAGIGNTEVEGGVETDRHGFLASEQPQAGMFAAGCAKRPTDVATSVRDATSVAMKTLKFHVE